MNKNQAKLKYLPIMNTLKAPLIFLLSFSTVVQFGSGSYVRKLGDVKCWNEISIQDDLKFKYRLDEDDDNKTYVSIELFYEAQAWISVGIPKEGDFRMIGSQAVIGIPTSADKFNPGIYDLNGKMLPRIELLADEYQTLFDHDIKQDETSTTLSFSKYVKEQGHNPLIVGANEPTTFIYAIGMSNTFGYHPKRGSFLVDFGLDCKNDEEDETKQVEVLFGLEDNIERVRKIWKVHGVLAALAWAIATPLAVLSSIFRSKFSGDGTWFKAHTTFNIAALILTLATVGIAFRTMQKDGQAHFSRPHHVVGLLILIFTLVQFIGAALRPKPSKLQNRRYWVYFHKVIAHVLLLMSLYQIVSGLNLYSMFYGSWNLYPVYVAWIVIVLLVASMGIIKNITESPKLELQASSSIH